MRRLFLSSLLVLGACGGGTTLPGEAPTGDTGNDDTLLGVPDFVDCTDTPQPLALDETSPLGFAAADVLATLAGPDTVVAAWAEREGQPTVTFTVASAGDPVFHDREVQVDTGPADTGGYAMGAPEPAPGGYSACSDYVEVPVQVTFVTDDGAFDESFTTALRIEDPTMPSLGVPLDPDALGGSFTFTEIDPAEWDEVSLQLEQRWTPEGPAGQVSMQASRELGTGPSGVAEGMVGPVLTWPVLE